MFDGFRQIYSEIPYILSGVGVTLSYAVIAVIFGFWSGTLLAVIKISNSCILRSFGSFYTSIFRGTPLLLQLFIIYFAIPQILGIGISAFMAGIVAFSLNSAAYVSEIIRAGIGSVDRGQYEVAKVLGCSRLQIMGDIIFPQAIRNVLPSLVNETIDLLKESALVSIIGEADLLRRANIVASEHYLYLEPLLVAGACYYTLVMILGIFAKLIEKKLSC
ncbi:MAG: amino acid ABC transporter permease [Puniceicoccales bacterium]|jgi:His/Glu/Gln/Arg/opine family amino acid ABC transporter permease subunit|nr:amino acid ABC transporter permease [Puniceicoccales bacterium]